MTYDRYFAMLTLLVGSAGCSDLELLNADTCGNLVVETDAGEDCDDDKDGCGASGSTNACRFTCETNSTGCPTSLGYQCGSDFVCRRSSNTFASMRTYTTETARDLLVGDVGADGCAEVIVTAKRSMIAMGFASDKSQSCVDSEQTLRTNRPDPARIIPTPLPILTDLTPSDDSGKLSLLSANPSQFGDGLSLHFTSETSVLSPVLFPRIEKPAAAMRVISATLLNTEALVLLEQRSADKTDVAIIFDATKPPSIFPDALPIKIDEIASIITADVFVPPVMPPMMPPPPCQELVVTKKGSTVIELYQLCTPNGGYQFAPLPNPKITLMDTTVRNENTRLIAADVNGDMITDIVVNGADFKAHVAYGLGDGRFHSTEPPLAPMVMPNQKTSTITTTNMAETTAAGEDRIFIAVEMDSMHAGVEFYGPPCPPHADTFTSPTCGSVTGGCEAIVVDIDNDGDQDVVVSEGQGVDLAIHRQSGGAFNVTFLDTTCPPHNLGAGDFDGDGVNDVAFFDQATNSRGDNTTSLSIVYGNALAAPNAPLASGRFDDATSLSAVHLGDQGSGSFIAMTRTIDGSASSAMGFVEVGNERAISGPFYLKSDATGSQSLDSLDIVAHAAGAFASGSDLAFAVLTDSASTEPNLWLVQPDEKNGLLKASSMGASSDIPCDDACLLATVPQVSPEKPILMLLGKNVAVLYAASSTGFEQTRTLTLTHAFSSKITKKNPPDKDNLRPLVADIDHDGQMDVLAIATTGALVGLFGAADGSFSEVELLPGPSCVNYASCGNYAPVQINLDGDENLELIIATPLDSMIPSPGSLKQYEIDGKGAARKLKAIGDITLTKDGRPINVDILADSDRMMLEAGDIDGDGVTDLVFMPSSDYFTVLRGLPVHE